MLSHLLWRSSQHAEYLADRSAASVAGTKAMLGLLDKLQLDATFDLTLQRVAYGLDREQLFDALRRRVRQVPAREMERIRRVRRLADARLDTTHPPIAYRSDLVQSGIWERPSGLNTMALVHDASVELAALEEAFAVEMIAEYISKHRSNRRS